MEQHLALCKYDVEQSLRPTIPIIYTRRRRVFSSYDYHGADYDIIYLLQYKTVCNGRSRQEYRLNISPPLSGWMIKPRKRPVRNKLQAYFSQTNATFVCAIQEIYMPLQLNCLGNYKDLTNLLWDVEVGSIFPTTYARNMFCSNKYSGP
jgi:hypothetical protein